MVLNFDIDVFCENLRATKPPYECPVKTCGKVYKSFAGIQFHMHSHNRDTADDVKSNRSSSVVEASSVSPILTSNNKDERRNTVPASGRTGQCEIPSPHGRSRIVEVEVGGGQTVKVDVRAPLNVFIRHDEDCGHGVTKDTVTSSKCSPTSLKDAGRTCKESTVSLSPVTKLPEAQFRVIDDFVKCPNVPQRPANYYRFTPKTAEELDKEIDYDMDELDANWLRLINEKRRKKKQTIIPKEIFEQLMDCFEKESFFQPLIEPGHQMPADDDAICCICFDGECHMHNVILFCDLCNLAVHQECYGVPTVPDGPWLCRRCLLSPSHAVSCCLCPSLRGAFKQTDDGRWAHVVCAQWIPAVGFANGVFLEPVDGISRIAPARWKLTCYICKLRGVGACIQCHKPSCYTAFHVTCAMQAGLYMKVERVKDTGPPGPNGNQAPNFKKLAYCDVHYPASLELPSGSQLVTRDEEKAHMHIETEDNMQERFLKNAREIRRLLTEKTPPGPVLSVPVVSPSSIAKIMGKVSIDDKKEFIDRLHSYWTLKRDAFNGVSLISMTAINVIRCRPHSSLPVASNQPALSNQVEMLKSCPPSDSFQAMRRLRQQMEKVRLLLELIKKRERMKLEQVKQYEVLTEMRLRPLTVLLRRALEQIESSENGHLSELWRKVNNYHYASVEEFASEFELVTASLLEASKYHGTIHKTCLRIRDQGTEVIQSLRDAFERIGFNSNSGLHSALENEKSLERQTSLTSVVPVCDAEHQSSPADFPPAASAPSGVNRRTMILFSKKAKQRRLSAIQLAAGKDSIQELLAETVDLTPSEDADENIINMPPPGSSGPAAAKSESPATIEDSNLTSPPAKRKRGRRKLTDSNTNMHRVSSSEIELMPNKLRSRKAIDDTHRGTDELQTKNIVVVEDVLQQAANDVGRYQARGQKSLTVMDGKTRQFHPLDIVWAKCKGFPSYPAMVIDPRHHKNNYRDNGVDIPRPPEDVVQTYRGKLSSTDMLLVVFFDVKHTWQWLHRTALEPLGTDTDVDTARLSAPMKPSMRKAVRMAYDRAMHRLSTLSTYHKVKC